MASIKNLKKEINNSISDLITECYYQKNVNKADGKKSEAIVDEAIKVFDDLITKINTNKVENTKKHFQEITKELQENVAVLKGKVQKL